jgi:hypothetical protein
VASGQAATGSIVTAPALSSLPLVSAA